MPSIVAILIGVLGKGASYLIDGYLQRRANKELTQANAQCATLTETLQKNNAMKDISANAPTTRGELEERLKDGI